MDLLTRFGILGKCGNLDCRVFLIAYIKWNLPIRTTTAQHTAATTRKVIAVALTLLRFRVVSKASASDDPWSTDI